MEKLRQLLNSYEEYKEKETGYSNYDWRLNEINDEEEHEQWITAFRVDDSQLGVEESIAVIICRGYCFIEWLVENDKIDPEGILAENLTYTHFQIPPQYFRGGKYKNITEQMLDTFYLRILACLSIQDNPIKFLISILK